MAEEDKSDYGKRPLWQWVLIYAAIGIVVYGLIYYFVFAKKKGYNYNSSSTTPPSTNSEATAPATEVSKTAVTLTADGFSPATLTIKAGDKVTWVNKSGTSATVNSDPHPTHTDYSPLNLGTFPDGGTLSLTFDKPGIYKYHNHLNPSQSGTITVQ